MARKSFAPRASLTRPRQRPRPPLAQLLEASLQLGHPLRQQLQLLLRQAPDAERPGAADGRIACRVIEQCHLPEELAGAEPRDHMVADQHLRLSVEDGVDAVAQIALPEHLLPWLEVLAQQELVVAEAELHQLRRQEQIERP